MNNNLLAQPRTQRGRTVVQPMAADPKYISLKTPEHKKYVKSLWGQCDLLIEQNAWKQLKQSSNLHQTIRALIWRSRNGAVDGNSGIVHFSAPIFGNPQREIGLRAYGADGNTKLLIELASNHH